MKVTDPARRAHLVTLGLVALTALLIGTNYVALKEALPHTTPLVLTCLRVTIGAVTLGSVARLRGERLPRDRAALASIFWVSLCISTISSGLLAEGVRQVSAGLAALLSATMPLFAAVLALVLLAERPHRLALAGLAIGVVGAAVLASPALDGRSSIRGILTLLAGTFFWALGVVVLKRRNPVVAPITLVAVQLGFSALCLWPVALAVDGIASTEWSGALAVPTLWASIPALAVPFTLMATVVRRAPTVIASSIAYLVPVFGLVAATLWRHESFEPAELAGGALVVVGVVAVGWPR